jgi:SAM-dependent methyltransferase
MALERGMNFDRLAPHYDWMEAVAAGRLLQQARTTWIDELAGRRRVLSVGEGHGKFAAAFTRRFPEATLTCIEASARMLRRGRRRTDRAGGAARWIHATVPAWSPSPQAFDAIVTCFFLDCFPPDQLRTLVGAIAAGATADATWMVVDFALPDRGVARWRARAIHAAMYSFFRMTTHLPARRLTPSDPFLRSHGFRLAARREFSCGLLRADLWRRSTPGPASGPLLPCE